MSAVQLGFADKRRAPGLRGETYDNRLGGLPAYYEKSQPRPTCASCTTPLFLVAQIFAPTDRDRTLLVWGCNSVACTALTSTERHGGSWVVQRTQSSKAYAASTPLPPAHEDARAVHAADPWGASSAWGDAQDIDVPLPLPKEAAPPEAPPTSAARADLPVHRTEYPASATDKLCFPAFRLCIAAGGEDEEEAAARESSASGDDDDDDDWGDDERSAGGAAAVGEAASDEARRWREYEQWCAAVDGDAGSAAAAPTLREGGSGGGDASEGDSGEEGEEGEAPAAAALAAAGGEGEGAGPQTGAAALLPLAQQWSGAWGPPAAAVSSLSRTKARQPVAQGCAGAGGVGGAARAGPGGAGGSTGAGRSDRGGGGDQYEPTPAALRFLLRFQAWLRRAGQPSVRYAYGLTPRWPAPPRAVFERASVPRCACGLERVFELQLLPPLLAALEVDDHTDVAILRRHGATAAAEGGSEGATAASHTTKSWGGLDFASVLVYSCPASCDASEAEFAVAVLEE